MDDEREVLIESKDHVCRVRLQRTDDAGGAGIGRSVAVVAESESLSAHRVFPSEVLSGLVEFLGQVNSPWSDGEESRDWGAGDSGFQLSCYDGEDGDRNLLLILQDFREHGWLLSLHLVVESQHLQTVATQVKTRLGV